MVFEDGIPSKVQIAQIELCDRLDRIGYELQWRLIPSLEQATMHLQDNLNDQGIRYLLIPRPFGNGPEQKVNPGLNSKIGHGRTSTPSESTDSFHRGLRCPTRLERSVRLLYAGGISDGY